MPPALARVGESAAIRGRWGAGATIALGLRLGASAFALPAYEARLARTLSSFQPDIIHTNGFKAHVLGVRLRLPHRVVVWHLHEYVSRRRLTRWLLRRYAGRCEAIVANSASVAADIASIFATPPPVHVVRNAVDLTVFTPDGPRLDLDALAGLPAAPADVMRVGLVATFGRWKGQEVFLDALQRVSGSQSIRGYIIGGPLYDTSGSQYSKRELTGHDRRPQSSQPRGSDGFSRIGAGDALTRRGGARKQRARTVGLVIAEAMACGRSVITTAHGGAAELIEAGRDALVAPVGDARALATAIDRLAADPALRESIGRRAHAAAMTRFAPDRMAVTLARIFENVGKSAGPRRPLAQSA